MTMLADEIVDKFQKLDAAEQAHVLQRLASLPRRFDWNAWSQTILAVREEIKAANSGVMPVIDVVGMLQDIREGEDDEE